MNFLTITVHWSFATIVHLLTGKKDDKNFEYWEEMSYWIDHYFEYYSSRPILSFLTAVCIVFAEIQFVSYKGIMIQNI